jgi:hypothetical protein
VSNITTIAFTGFASCRLQIALRAPGEASGSAARPAPLDGAGPLASRPRIG